MYGLLIDNKAIIKEKMDNLINFSGIIPETINAVGVIYLIPKDNYKKLLNTSTDMKSSYVNSDSFIKSIDGFYFIIYNKQRKICEIRGHIEDKHLKNILESLSEYLPIDIRIWVGVVPLNKTDSYIKAGFDNPYVTDHSPLLHTFGYKGISFSKLNSNNKKDIDSVRNKLNNAVNQSDKICNMYCRFSSRAIHYFKKINDPNNKNQKELSGSLKVSKVIRNYNKTIFELSPDHNSLIHGSEDEVHAVLSRYNFHTHPKKAYDNQGVIRGWPSSQDFVGFLGLNDHTIFHTVVTLEGIYIISLSNEYTGKISDINKKFVYSHYDINHETEISFNEYVKRINAKKYKGKQLFVLQYLPWNKSNKEFPIYYSKTKDKCLTNQTSYEMNLL
jgi:hypothetical protein